MAVKKTVKKAKKTSKAKAPKPPAWPEVLHIGKDSLGCIVLDSEAELNYFKAINAVRTYRLDDDNIV